jgi:hypothetical protein
VVACQAAIETQSISPNVARPSVLHVAAASTKATLTISSTYGALLDNPVTKAVLLKFAPEVVNNPQSQMGRDLAFKDLAQFEPTLTPDKLQEIDAALAKAQEK